MMCIFTHRLVQELFLLPLTARDEIHGKDEQTVHRQTRQKRLAYQECFLALFAHNDCYALLIELRPPRPSHHLKDISDRVVDVTRCFSVEELSALHNNEMRREIHAPRQSCGCDKHLDVALQVQPFYGLSILRCQTRVVQANAECDGVSQILVVESFSHGINVRVIAVQK